MQRKSLANDPCPIARGLDLFGDPWSILIIRDAIRGARRFSEFERSLPVAKNILSARLRRLVEGGILTLVPASDGSAYSEYALTVKGASLRPVIRSLWAWGAEHLFAPKTRPTRPRPLPH